MREPEQSSWNRLSPLRAKLGLIAALSLGFGASQDADALRFNEDGDGSPLPPCVDVNIAVGAPKLKVMGDALKGCSVQISAGRSKISLVRDLCHDPTYFDLTPSVPIKWELVSFPAGAAPSFTFNSTLATLNLPREGDYRVRFTICPSDDCTFRPSLTGPSYPLRRSSQEVVITAENGIPIRPEEYPILPASATAATMPTDFTDRDCLCVGFGGLTDPQWVTTSNWTGARDFQRLEGRVFKSWVSTKDSPLNHDSQDVNFSVVVDPRDRFLLTTEPEFGNVRLLGVEFETGSFPERMRPILGDRVSVFGYWIVDCGHGGTYSEIHPPVGVAVHRARPIAIPDDEPFEFALPGGTVTSTVGQNVYVPGILTDLWFTRHTGAITGSGRTTLHQPAHDATGPGCATGDDIAGLSPLDRVFEFNVYLPRDPSVSAGMQGVTAPRPPIYFKVSNPWGFAGPDPVVTPRTEGDVTYLHVSLDFRGADLDNYSRRIEAAWVHPAPDNWGLKRWHVTFQTLDVHNDHDPWTDFPNQNGDWRFWMTMNNGEQEWTRILYGDNNAHGTMTFDPPWQTGSSDPELWRPFDSLELSHRLGPDVLTYPDQDVFITTTVYENDKIFQDDPGRVANARFSKAGTRKFTSNKGSYTIELDVQPGPPVGNANLNEAATSQYFSYVKTCDTGPYLEPVPPPRSHPLETASFIVPGISELPPWTIEANEAAKLGSAVAGIGDVNGDDVDDFLVGAPWFAAGTGRVGKASVYLGFGGDLSTSPYWSAVGEPQAAEEVFFGQSVSSAGDVNGDGFGDFLVGAPNFSNGQTNEGAAYLWLGGTFTSASNASPATASWMTEGNQAGSQYGFVVASAGDVNGDGFGDVAVGAPWYENNTNVAGTIPLGRVFVYLGSSNGLSTTVHRTLFAKDLPGSEGWFGYSIAAADLDNDGCSDLVVGMPHYSGGQDNEGMLLLYHGSTNGLIDSLYDTAQSDQTGAMLGWSVAPAGDVDGDGYEDVVAGAPGYATEDIFGNEGAAFLFRGNLGGIFGQASWAVAGYAPESKLGTSVAGAGDLDGDGLADVIVGAPGFSLDATEQGAIFVFRGTNGFPGLPDEPIWAKLGPRPTANFGAAVASAGDVDGDGFGDIIVGAPEYESGEDLEGSVFVFHGTGPREIQPAESLFLEDVETEENVLYNLDEPEFAPVLLEGLETYPDEMAAMLANLRATLLPNGGSEPTPETVADLQPLRDVLPPELWQAYFGDVPMAQGGALFVNCGASEETTADTVDTLGRHWRRDTTFLVTADTHTAGGENEMVDLTLLSDTNLPNSVILSRRWIAGDLHYEVPAPNGLHTVILYLAESCSTCVNSNLGGVGPNDATRVLDLEVEGKRVDGYNPADAAVPPDGDGVGAVLAATQIVFRDVNVTDGILNVAVLQHDPQNGSGNASLNALAILQQPSASGVVAPHIVSLQRVEDALQIEVATGPNLATYLAGLANLSLEESADLETWTSVGMSPIVAGDHVIFEPVPVGSARFYRVVASPVTP